MGSYLLALNRLGGLSGVLAFPHVGYSSRRPRPPRFAEIQSMSRARGATTPVRELESLTDKLQSKFREASVQKTKDWFEKYMKHVIKYRGLKTPEVRKLVAEWYREEEVSKLGAEQQKQVETAETGGDRRYLCVYAPCSCGNVGTRTTAYLSDLLSRPT